MTDPSILQKNLESLRLYQPLLGSKVKAAQPVEGIVTQLTRDGTTSIVVKESGDRTVQLHSRYRPLEEAERTVDTLVSAATLVVMGMGGMFVPRQYLKRYSHSSVLAVERDASTVRALLEILDLSDLFKTGRLRIADDENTLFSQLTSLHQPAIQDGIVTYTLRAWTERKRNHHIFGEYHRQLQENLRHIAGEYRTMSHYGRSWFIHTLKNTLQINWSDVVPSVEAVGHIMRSAPTRIVAAGPSLDVAFHRISEERSSGGNRNNIIVDTALPAITGRNLPCVGVVTLDPQGWSPLHFRSLRTRVPFLWADLGVSPLLQKWADHFLPLGSNHPLHRLLARSGFPLFHIPGSRNVSETAARIVHVLGGTIGDVIGDDFAYPAGKTYARGTYHYGIARGMSSRIYPEETFFADQVYPDSRIDQGESDITEGHPRFRKPGMSNAEKEFRNILHTGTENDSFVHIEMTGGEGKFDIATFWKAHVEELELLLRHRLPCIGRSTPEILEILGPHGRAHLPLLPTLAKNDRSLQENLSKTFDTVRGFIFSDLGRYSKRDEG